jgi:hypothetical protein
MAAREITCIDTRTVELSLQKVLSSSAAVAAGASAEPLQVKRTYQEASMRRLNCGWTFVLAVALAVPSFAGLRSATAKTSKAAKSDDAQAQSAGSSDTMSKEDQEKLREHNKLRAEIKKVKYPAAKADVVAHVKGIKPDDKKWFEETLPDKTYASADDVYSALGWPTGTPEGESGAPASSSGHSSKSKASSTK